MIAFNRSLEFLRKGLAIAERVALAKWDCGTAVEDAKREAQVVRAAVASAKENIQLCLLRAGLGARWTAACEIRSQNGLTRYRYAKDYDAVVAVRVDSVERCFALEYKRSAKARKDYLAIADLLDQEKQVSHLLYLAANHDVLNYLRGVFRPTPVSVWFGIVRDWHAQLLSMPVVDASSFLPQPLYEALELPRFDLRAP